MASTKLRTRALIRAFQANNLGLTSKASRKFGADSLRFHRKLMEYGRYGKHSKAGLRAARKKSATDFIRSSQISRSLSKEFAKKAF